jgi:hypothetical protein
MHRTVVDPGSSKKIKLLPMVPNKELSRTNTGRIRALFNRSHGEPVPKPNFLKMERVIAHHARELEKVMRNKMHDEEAILRAGEQVGENAITFLAF